MTAPPSPRTSELSFSFVAPGKRLNSNDRMHWARRAGITSMWRQAGHLYAKRTLGNRHWTPAPSTVLVTFEVKDPSRRRDPMNAYPTVKALIDGCTDAGVWPDDNAEWVTVLQPVFTRGHDRVRIDITPTTTEGKP